MSPRKYDSSRRAAAAQQTRRRIVEATFEVHGEQGIAAARMDEIARRAGVAVATVYRHFPSYDDLVAACGQMTFERTSPPEADAARAAFAGIDSRPARLERLVDELYGFYERTGPMIEAMRRDRAAVPPVDAALERLEAAFDAWVDAALEDASEQDRALARALVDHRTWTALTAHGVADARGAAVRLLGGD